MAIRQEQIVFAVAVVGLGALVLTSKSIMPKPLRAGAKLELEDVTVPDTGRVLPTGAAGADATYAKDLFQEPTNERPMPLLAFAAPPLVPLPSLAAPPLPGRRVPMR